MIPELAANVKEQVNEHVDACDKCNYQSHLEVTAEVIDIANPANVTTYETAELAILSAASGNKDGSLLISHQKGWANVIAHECLEKLEDLKKTCYKCEHGNKHRSSFKLHMKGQH